MAFFVFSSNTNYKVRYESYLIIIPRSDEVEGPSVCCGAAGTGFLRSQMSSVHLGYW